MVQMSKRPFNKFQPIVVCSSDRDHSGRCCPPPPSSSPTSRSGSPHEPIQAEQLETKRKEEAEELELVSHLAGVNFHEIPALYLHDARCVRRRLMSGEFTTCLPPSHVGGSTHGDDEPSDASKKNSRACPTDCAGRTHEPTLRTGRKDKDQTCGGVSVRWSSQPLPSN